VLYQQYRCAELTLDADDQRAESLRLALSQARGGFVVGARRGSRRPDAPCISGPSVASFAVETLDTYSHLWPDSENTTRSAVEVAFSQAASGCREDDLRTETSA